jgi:hypothetical protein
VTSGLIQCGVDPQAPEWTTAQGKTPLDYLVSLQRPDGHFDWTDEFGGGAFETYSSVRPLGGDAFSAAPPARFDGSSPAVRPATPVALGTTVPITLVIDHGPGSGDVRMCRVDVATGADLEQVLSEAKTSSSPAGCVAGFDAGTDAAGVHVESLDGVAQTSDYEWRASLDGGAVQSEASETVGLGDLVFLQFAAKVANPGAAPKVKVPPLQKTKKRGKRGARVAVRGKAHLQGGGVAIRLRCPRGNGAGGCRGTLTVQYRLRRGDALRTLGSAGFAVDSGAARSVAVDGGSALTTALAARARLRLRLTAATRAEDGSVRLTHARRNVSG